MGGDKTVSGGCLCGAVAFELRLPSKWCAHCHCNLCRQSHGAGFVTWVGFEQDQFDLADGQGKLAWYRSSAEAERGFCRHCGSSILFRSTRWPGEIHVALACINGTIDRQPAANVCLDDRVDWMPIDHELASIKL